LGQAYVQKKNGKERGKKSVMVIYKKKKRKVRENERKERKRRE
jgi:hypothetical protein